MAEPQLLQSDPVRMGLAGEPGFAAVGPSTYRVGVQTDAPADFNETLRLTRGWAQDDYNASVAGATARANAEAADKAFFEDMLQQSRAQDAAKAVEAAQRFQSLRAYNRDYNAMVAAGESPEQAAVLGALKNPGLFAGSPSAFARVATARGQAPLQPIRPEYITLGKTAGFWNPKTGSFQPEDTPRTLPPSSLVQPMQSELSDVNRMIASAEASGVTTNAVGSWPKMLGGNRGEQTEEAKRLQALYQKRDALKQELSTADAARGVPPLVSAGAAPPAVAPADMSKTTGGDRPSFNTLEEAIAAGHKKGDKVRIGGVDGTLK